MKVIKAIIEFIADLIPLSRTIYKLIKKVWDKHKKNIKP